MKTSTKLTFLASIVLLTISAQAKIITVNTTNNISPGAGETNLVQAINLLADGDTIRFNIPGTGARYIETPVGGYPLITKNNLTIDGYSQPGSSPNSNTMLGANNAVLRIVIDSRNGEGTSNPGPGFGAGEIGSLFVMGTNNHFRGLCFLGPGNSGGANDVAAINIGNTAHKTHVSGCWIGVDTDGTTLYTYDRGPTAFGDVVAGVPSWPIGTVIGVAPGAADSAGARAQQNVIIGSFINIFLESMNMVIAGNKLNVFPDGMRDVDQTVAPIEAVIETGRVNNNMRVGTDGDGLNDAEERNVFGGVSVAGDDNIIEIYGQNGTVGACTNIVIAGNYFGVAVDGATRFTNSMLMVDRFTRIVSGVRSDCQFGSDFDGVSDDIEGNVIFMNNPFSTLFPDPSTSLEPRFCNLSAEGRLSFRGNKLINNNLLPFSYADGSGGRLSAFTNYEAAYMDTTANIIPYVDPGTNVFPHVIGTFAPGIAPYTTIIIDVYELDPEGWQNGQAFGFSETIDAGSGATNGFPQGKKYVGSFTVPNTGSFDINLAGKAATLGPLTLTVNYSADPAGTHRGRVHTSNFSNPFSMIPGGAESAGLTHVVPDSIFWFDGVTGRPRLGGYDLPTAITFGGSVEPYAGQLGDSTFLLAASSYAADGASMRFTSILQPAAGGTPRIGDLFYDDLGHPYTNRINESRQDGNPGRVAGDPRYGAANFMGGGEVSLWNYPGFFNSNGRFDPSGPFYATLAAVSGRECCVQTYSLNPLTLTQTMFSKALSSAFGRCCTNASYPNSGQNQISRFGGHLQGLDNGNFVSVVEDRSGLNNPSGNASVATIFRPDGSIVKEAFKVANADQWANVAAFRGGFTVRPSGGVIYFFDNAGNPQGSLNHNTTSGLTYDTGRGDGTRTVSDIRSHYVYMAGVSGGHVWLSVFDAQTRAFVTKAQVDEVASGLDRVNLAVDALDRVCVVYKVKPTPSFTVFQTAARVMSFDGATIAYLTPSFFPFINHDSDGSLQLSTEEPSVAMTPRQIFVSAKGVVNSTNNPSAGVDTGARTDLYTVISHPAPVAAPRPNMTITRAGSNVTISWPADAGLFTVQSTTSLASPISWTDVTAGHVAPPVSVPLGAGNTYFRLLRQW